MLSVTVNSCIEACIPIGLEKCEIIICDNSDTDKYPLLNAVLPIGYIKDGLLKIFRQDFPCLFTARETAIEHSQGEYIICVDSHMLIGHNTFYDMLKFMERRKYDQSIAFAHAPINWSNKHTRNARHDRDMDTNELGDWHKAYQTARTITWKGMPWICRKSIWKEIKGYGALSQHRISWGGGDMHIGIKPWLLGYTNWAIPTRPCIHIGPFPKIDNTKNPNVVKVSQGDGYKYRLWSESGTGPHALGFLVSCYVLGGERMMSRNRKAITKRFGQFINVDQWWQRAMIYGKDEKAWLDENKKLTFEQLLERKPWDEA